jgi:hypothetical protein
VAVEQILVYVLVVLIAAQAQKWFFDSVAAHDRSVKSDAVLAAEVLDDPLGVVGAVEDELPRRLRTLFRRQPSRSLELKRWLALTAIATMFAVFIWFAVASNTR